MTASHSFRVLISRDAILRRVQELAAAIDRDYPDALPLGLVVIEGARMFARQLTRALGRPLSCAEVRASSYGNQTVSSGKVALSGMGDLQVAGRPVLLLEDIVDTGRTIAALREKLLADGAVEVRVATLLSKPARRVVEVDLDYVGFEIPDEFVIGYGMDYAGRYRELDEVVVYEESKAAHCQG